MEQSTGEAEIDRQSPVPLYHQLETLIRKGIDSGHYPPGSLLPSEGELCTRYGVSRSVVRQTLTNLAHEGVIRTQRGRGSFVAEEKVHERFVQRAAGMFEDLQRMGYEVRTAVIGRRSVTLPLPVQEFLGTDRGIRIDRLRSVEGRVLVLIRSYLPEGRFSGLLEEELEDRSLYGLIQQRYGVRLVRGNRSVEAIAANGETAKRLEVDVGEPLLFLRGTSRDQDGRPLEWFEAWHRSDRTSFEIEIIDPGEDLRGDPHVDGIARPLTEPASARVGDAGLASVTPMLRRELAPAAAAGMELHDRVAGSRAVALLGGGPIREPRGVVATLEDHGFSVLALTVSDDDSLRLLEAIATSGSFVGARGVIDGVGARRALAAGACFLMAPIDVQAQILPAVDGSPVIFSGITPSELATARRVGQTPIEVFPLAIGGLPYFRSLQPSLPDLPLIPSGGISDEDASSYLDAGALAVGLDTELCHPETLAVGDLPDLRDRAARFRRSIERAAPA